MTDANEKPARFAPPSARESLCGHKQIEVHLRRTLETDRLHHAWMISGPQGLGKTTLAFRFARALLAPDALSDFDTLHMPADARAFRLTAQNAHPDLIAISRPWDDKKKRFANELTVDEVRRLNGFFTKTAAEGGRRVAIVDCVDDMNRNAANALLKILEEPPKASILLLICHAPGRALATVRSRCSMLKLNRLSDDSVARFLREEGAVASDTAALELARVARGCPGRAITLAQSGAEASIKDAPAFLEAASSGAWPRVRKIAERYSAAADAERFGLWREFLLNALAEKASASARQNARASACGYAEAWSRAREIFDDADAVNMDRKQSILQAAFSVHNAMRGG